MGKRTLYFLFTDTGTNLSRLINFFTRASLNHVSIAFDKELSKVYSFGRKRPRNPFIGGFVHEEIHGEFLSDSNCAIYKLSVSEEQYAIIQKNLQVFEDKKDDYRYNFLGLIGYLLRVEIERENAYFCSQFIATVMKDTGLFSLHEPFCFVTPTDIRNQEGMELMYQGILGEYPSIKEAPLTDESIEVETFERESIIFTISRKMKELVIR